MSSLKNLPILRRVTIVVFLSTFVALIWWMNLRKQGPIEVSVSFSEDLLPVVETHIGQTCLPCGLFLASRYPLYLSEEWFAQNRVNNKGEGSWTDENGQQCRVPLFVVPSVSLGKLKLGKVLAAPKDPPSLNVRGAIEWPLQKINVLIDLPRYTVWGIESNNQLRSLGFNLGKMKKVKCTVNHGGIHFISKTSLGTFNTYLSTGANYNVVNTSILTQAEVEQKQFKSQLHVGNHDLGETIFYPFELAPELEMDLILGTAFLRDHVVYIDADHECLYIGDRYTNTLATPSIVQVPLELMWDGRPVVEVEIEGLTYHFLIDLGSETELTCFVDNGLSASLRKLYDGQSINFRETSTDTHYHLLPSCTIGDSELTNVLLAIRNPVDCATGYKVEKRGGQQRSHNGLLGHAILHRANLFFDIPHSQLWLVGHQESFGTPAIDLSDCEKLSFEMARPGCVVTVGSDLGEVKLLIDTGATHSVIKPRLIPNKHMEEDNNGNLCYRSSNFILSDSDYGEQKLFPLEISSQFGDIDGILGVDFLSRQAFFIDYPNRLIYFQKPDPNATSKDESTLSCSGNVRGGFSALTRLT